MWVNEKEGEVVISGGSKKNVWGRSCKGCACDCLFLNMGRPLVQLSDNTGNCVSATAAVTLANGPVAKKTQVEID